MYGLSNNDEESVLNISNVKTSLWFLQCCFDRHPGSTVCPQMSGPCPLSTPFQKCVTLPGDGVGSTR